MTTPEKDSPPASTTGVVPQLSVRHGRAAIEFYKTAFGALEEYRVGGTDPAATDPAATDPVRDGPADDEAVRVFRPAGISYLHLPAPDPARSVAFYREVFAWNIRDDGNSPAFADGTGHVIGHFIPELAVAGEAGVLPYVFVDDVDVTLEMVADNGGTIVRPPYPEGDLWVATINDPAGNVIGIWQSGPRSKM